MRPLSRTSSQPAFVLVTVLLVVALLAGILLHFNTAGRTHLYACDAFVADSYRDDMALTLEMGDQLALLCGCCHAGLLNTLAHAQRIFERPIVTIAGGLHLTSATADYLQRVSEVLMETESVRRVYPNHCTGEAAFVALTLTLGPSAVSPCPAGTVVEF